MKISPARDEHDAFFHVVTTARQSFQSFLTKLKTDKFLDEANRTHPTVIQTLFQIITERTCGEHLLPDRTYIVLAGNLGEGDDTTITEFDDAALDGRLAIFHLKPTARDWIPWAESEGLHPAVLRYISLYLDRLWDEVNIDPNPRGWHQMSTAIASSYGLSTEEDLTEALASDSVGLARYVYYAGNEWRAFDFDAGFESLIRCGDAEHLFYAGAYWKRFDHIRGFNRLVELDISEFIYKAGTLWPIFDYRRAWEALAADPAGSLWRSKAFMHPRWRAALRSIWREEVTRAGLPSSADTG